MPQENEVFNVANSMTPIRNQNFKLLFFPEGIFKCISVNVWISANIALKYVLKITVDKIWALVQVMLPTKKYHRLLVLETKVLIQRGLNESFICILLD